MNVIGISSAPRELPGFDRMVHRDDLVETVRELDYFLLLTPYSPETHNIIGAEVFAAMKPQSFFINHARGGVVDEMALLAALREGRIAGAALDVFATEPLPQDHPFWAMENVLITCHQSATHDASVATNLPIIVENIRRFIGGDIAGMRNVVRRAK
jgi:phosphoglycerate dehydrogenase-like enzyme